MLTAAMARLRALLFPGTVQREIDEELRDHFEREVAFRVAQGENAHDASLDAKKALGNVTLHRENAREAYGWRWADELRQDLRYALRCMSRAPVVTAVIVFVLAVGIGPNAALISYVSARLAHLVPGVEDADGLVNISFSAGPTEIKLSQQGYDSFRQQQQWLEAIARSWDTEVGLTVGGTQSMVEAQVVTGSYFKVMRLHMTAGAGIPAIDDRSLDPPLVAVANYRFWMTNLGGSPAAIGRSVRVNGVPMTIVGVMPKEFRAPPLTLPYAARRTLSLDAIDRDPRGFREFDRIVARLRPAVGMQQAKAGAVALAATIQEPSWGKTTAVLSTPGGRGGILGASRALGLLPIITILTLLISCANASILLLGRAVGRRREIAVRLSMGADRARIVRQLLTESALLAGLACAVGLLLLFWANAVLWVRYPALSLDLAPSWSAIAVTAGLAILTGAIFGLLPALHATRVGVGDALKDTVAGFDARRGRLQRGFVVAEVALSITLVCATGLFVNAFRGMMEIQGFAASPSVLVADLDFESAHFSAPRAADFQERAREGIATLRGVKSVGFADDAPISHDGPRAIGDPAAPGMPFRSVLGRPARIDLVDPGFFDAMEMPLTAGRDISTSDVASGPPVAIISAGIADTLWPGVNPIGQSMRIQRYGHWVGTHHFSFDTLEVTVIGVAQTTQLSALDHGVRLGGGSRLPPDESMIYLSRRQWPDSGPAKLIVRATHPDAALAAAIEQQLRSVDGHLPFSAVISADQYERAPYKGIYAAVTGIVWAGALVLLLACIGIYAVIAFGIGQRTREIGVRLALGAQASQVVWLFFRDGMWLSVVGFAIGVPLALLFMKLTVAREFGTQMLAPLSVASIVAVLLGVAALASWLPARRAAAVDPLVALRSE